MTNEKPSYRAEKYEPSSDEPKVLASTSIRKTQENLQEKTFCFCNPECDCNPVCNCERDCSCDDHKDSCRRHCYCHDYCSCELDCVCHSDFSCPVHGCTGAG